MTCGCAGWDGGSGDGNRGLCPPNIQMFILLLSSAILSSPIPANISLCTFYLYLIVLVEITCYLHRKECLFAYAGHLGVLNKSMNDMKLNYSLCG